MTITPTLFKKICIALWGEQPYEQAARQIGVHTQTVHRWKDGKVKIQDYAVDALTQCLKDRAVTIDKLIAQSAKDQT